MELNRKEAVRIGVTYEDGNIFQHFGQTKQFKFYDTEDGQLVHGEVVTADGASHCSLGSFLFENHVSVLICGNIGAGASKALQAAGILVYAGNCGNADEAVDKLLRKELIYNPAPTCHDHHNCSGEHAENAAPTTAQQDEDTAGHNYFEGGHNHKDSENAGHNARIGYDR